MNLNEPAPLSRRLSHQYTSGYSHLDKWEDIGTITLLRSSETQGDDYSESIRRTVLVQFTGDALPVQDIKDALYDQFQSGCRCQHDCCGHYQSSMGKCLHLGAGRFAVQVNSYRNV